MLYDKNEIEFMEKRFSPKNKGYSMSSPAIDRCLFLSDMAKKVYSNISHYAYKYKRTAFPSQDLLAMELRTTRKRIGDYTAELERKGLLTKSKRGNSNNYYLLEIENIPVLEHSESIWKVFYELEDVVSIAVFDKAIGRYQESELFRTVEQSQIPSEYESQIRDYFHNTLGINKSRVVKGEQATINSIIEEITSYFYTSYENRYGNKIVPDSATQVRNLKNMERVLKSTGFNVNDVKTRINIFIESDSIDSCTISTFAKDSVQHRLTKAINNGEQTITMDAKKQSKHQIEYKPVQEYDDFFSSKKKNHLENKVRNDFD